MSKAEEMENCPLSEPFMLRFENLEGDIQEIRKALLGNGRPGLLDRVSKAEGQIKVVYGVLGALGAGVIALIVRLVDKLF